MLGFIIFKILVILSFLLKKEITGFHLFNLYDTEELKNGDGYCLHYFEKLDANELTDIIQYSIFKFCLRPFNLNEISLSVKENQTYYYRSFTFDQLRKQNITSEMLFLWSAPIDIIENYEIYLQNRSLYNMTNVFLSQKRYFNCTSYWVGPHCQFTFFHTIRSFTEQAREVLKGLPFTSYPDEYYLVAKDTCYTAIQCDYVVPIPFCLDWREVCDGKIDCLNGGIDEYNCFELELNECNLDEYRCHNGQCIPGIFWRDNPFHPDCLDRSDEMFEYSHRCFNSPSVACEEHTCRPGSDHYPCGDGQCGSCYNGRDDRLLASFSLQPKESIIPNNCWDAIVALTRTDIYTTTTDFKPSEYQYATIIRDFCPPLFEYPAHPVVHGHVRFIYDNKLTKSIFKMILPTYVCYDPKLCGQYLPPTRYVQIFNSSFTCRFFEEIPVPDDSKYKRNMFILIEAIEEIFSKCASYSQINYNITNCYQYSNLYLCINSTKCISKHRLLDGIQDCYLNDDERYLNSCLLTNAHRFSCNIQPNKCPSPLQYKNDRYDCVQGLIKEIDYTDIEILPKKIQNNAPISFQTLCDGFIERFPLFINENNETDETHCQYWPCSNMYTRCDGYWNCINGFDELNCTYNRNTFCNSLQIMCVSPTLLSPICLDVSKINDGNIDCLGSFDERQWCRDHYEELPSKRFRCHDNNSECISKSQLCDNVHNCMFFEDENLCYKNIHDPETEFKIGYSLCTFGVKSDYPYVNESLCRLTDGGKPTIVHFKLDNINEYSITKAKSNIANINNPGHMLPYDIRICNRGVPIFVRIDNKENYISKCLCPPSYYGENCQYQNQRISLSMQFQAEKEWHTVFIFLIRLIDNFNLSTIHSYDQINYLAMRDCNTKFNIYMEYQTRPKNFSKNYSIQIDVFNSEKFEYRTSWLYPIKFSFLPVHRMAIHIIIPMIEKKIEKECLMNCSNHGQCVRYENTNTMFCHCHSGWFGLQCSLKYEYYCSSDSLYVAPSICLCPIGKFGRRCYLRSLGCSNVKSSTCFHNGLCVPSDARFEPINSYICICPEGFWGDRCEYKKSQLDIKFHKDIIIPSSIYAHFITVDGHTTPKHLAMLAKIEFDQNLVTFYTIIIHHLVFIQIYQNYYLITLRSKNIAINLTRIELNPSQRCLHINEIFNSTIINYHPLRRTKYYHLVCQKFPRPQCFYDSDIFMCLCTDNQEANCFNFDYKKRYDCQGNNYCENKAQCFQDRFHCPTASVCACAECFYGSRCQFSTEAFGLSLDAIIGYHIRPYISFTRQSLIIKLSTFIVTLIFTLGCLSGLFSIITFSKKTNQETGCGIYLFTTSIISLLVIIMFAFKFLSLLLFQMAIITEYWILRSSCLSIDYILRILFNTGDWLNACVAIERVITVIKAVSFNKIKSKKVAKWIIMFVIFVTVTTALQDPFHRQLISDDEDRTWCIIRYTSTFQLLNSIMLMFHFLVPFAINFISALLIILLTARRRSGRSHENYGRHLCEQFHEHKHIIISPIMLVLLALPRLIISFQVGCMNAARDPWLLLISYFISFIPSMLILIVFILPSSMYRKSLWKTLKSIQVFIRQCFIPSKSTSHRPIARKQEPLRPRY